MIVYNNMINKNIAIFIDNLTEKIIDVYNIKIPIMNMKEVLKSIGGKIVYKNNYYELIDGNIIKTHDKKFDILLPILNKNSNNNFTIACNLGHIFLHMGYRTNFSLWNKIVVNKQYKFKSLKQERQAEYFALSLLMPKTIFLKVFYKYSNNNMVDMTEIANYFKVSINSARTRAYMLNLIDSSCLK
nr:MAG TPA: IrrE protein [Bacteriophage sp.]